MTEEEVVKKLELFKEKLIKFRDERNSAKEQLQDCQKKIDSINLEKEKALEENSNNLKKLHDSEISIDDFKSNLNNLLSQKDNLELEMSSFKDKTYKTIKHLVEDVIEVQESQIRDLTSELNKTADENKKLLIDLDNIKLHQSENINAFNQKIKDLESKLNDYQDPKKFISIEDHNSQVNELMKDKQKSDDEKQTVLSNTWKTQVKTSQELTVKTQELSFKEKELTNLKDSYSTLDKEYNDKLKEFENYKNSTTLKIQELENDNKKIISDSHTNVLKLEEKIKGLELANNNLETTKKELQDKLKNLESSLIKTPSEHQSNNTISKETIPYRFGSTTTSVMQKAKSFIEDLYKTATQIDGKYYLGNPKISAKNVGLSEREFNVFMNRLSECLELNGVPLIYQLNGGWMSNLSKINLIDYISTITN